MDNNDILFSKFVLPNKTPLKNRLAKAAMTEGLSIDGNPNQRLINLYETWSQGGAGLLISGNVMIERRYLERPGNVILDEQSDKECFQKWALSGQHNDTKFILQLSHPGRQCTKWVNSNPVSPSNVELDLLSMFNKPRALTEQEIHDIIRQFAKSAQLAEEYGFNGVQIHGAHGYLISQFLSPITNIRTDQWGGSHENRARFLLEVIKAVKNSVSEKFIVCLKLNSSDFQKGGYSIDDCELLIKLLNDYPLDFVELSGGTYEQPQLLGHAGRAEEADTPKRESTIMREAYFINYAKRVRQIATMPLMVTGGFEQVNAMKSALDQVDLIGIGRPFCVMPDWPNKLQAKEIDTLPRYEKRIVYKGKLGPNSPWFAIKGLNVQGEVAWFYYQILRLSDKKEPNLRKNLLASLIFHVIREQWLARKRSKHLRSGKQ